MGGKGGYRSEEGGEWIICRAAKCPAYPGTNLKSWRYISHGPDSCKFCKTPFRVPIPSDVGKSQDKSGKGKGTGGGGWKKQDSKGRTRNVEMSREELLDLVAQQCEGDEAALDALKALKPAVCPPKVLTPAEALRESMESCEKSEASVSRLEKQVAEMEQAELRRAEALLEYSTRVKKIKDELALAKEQHTKAQHDLRKAKANSPGNIDVAPAATTKLPEISTGEISQALAGLECVSSLNAQNSGQLGTFIKDLVKKQIQITVHALLPQHAEAAGFTADNAGNFGSQISAVGTSPVLLSGTVGVSDGLCDDNDVAAINHSARAARVSDFDDDDPLHDAGWVEDEFMPERGPKREGHDDDQMPSRKKQSGKGSATAAKQDPSLVLTEALTHAQKVKETAAKSLNLELSTGDGGS